MCAPVVRATAMTCRVLGMRPVSWNCLAISLRWSLVTETSMLRNVMFCGGESGKIRQ